MEFIQQNIFMIALAIVSGSLLLVTSFRRGGGRGALTPPQATALINRENALVIDVRDAKEYAGGHLPDARSLPIAQIEELAGELDKYRDTPLILVCQSGSRSAAACKKLEKLGFARVHNLSGGVQAWSEAGLPLRRGGRK